MPDPFDFDQLKFDDTVPKNMQDPTPAVKATRKAAAKKVTGTSRNTGPGRPSKNQKIQEMADEIIGFMMVTSIPLKMRDIHEDGSSCADVFFNDGQPTPELVDWAFKFATVGVDNKYISKFFALGEDAGKYLMLLMSTSNLVMPILQNHGPRRVKHDTPNRPVA